MQRGGGSGSAGIGDSCGSGLIYDCAMDCVSSSTAYSYMGDGSCDDGTWGYDLTCAGSPTMRETATGAAAAEAAAAPEAASVTHAALAWFMTAP